MLGFKPIFCDIDIKTLGLNNVEVLNKITDKTRAVFITHAQGFNALSDELLSVLKEKDICLIEDVCESHGTYTITRNSVPLDGCLIFFLLCSSYEHD